MNMGNTEAQLIISKTKSAEVKSGYEELTVKEMVQKGFSAHPVCISQHNHPQRETHHCVTPHLRTKIESIVRKGGPRRFPKPDK